jgi:hypothetical protein
LPVRDLYTIRATTESAQGATTGIFRWPIFVLCRARFIIIFSGATGFAAHVARFAPRAVPAPHPFLAHGARYSGWCKPSQGTPSLDEILALLLSFFHMSGM